MDTPLQRDRRRLEKLRKLTEVSRALTYAVSLDDVLRLAVEQAADLFDTDRAVLMLTNEDGLLSVRASHGIDTDVCNRFREPLDETLSRRLQGILGVTAAEGFLGVPLVASGQVTGVLAVGSPHTDLGVEENEWLLSALADQAAVALEKTRLDEASAFRERLIGIVGHDLRNPLSAIMMASNLLLVRYGLGEKETALARRIASSADRMNHIVAQLLDFTRSRLGGGVPVTLEPADLQGISLQVVEEIELAYPGVALHFQAEGDLKGSWDRGRIAQVLSNLVSNAIQHGMANAPIEIRARGEEGHVLVAVHNEGPAIAADVIDHIFDPFRQGSAENGRSTNLGLGLYIAQQIVLAHEGEMTVQSVDAQGTTFRVRLPRSPRKPTAPTGAHSTRSG
jgi:signal transduction histidine kinase